MFVAFFHELKAAGVPVTLREYLTLMEAMEKDLAGRRVEDFYYLSRAALVKDERNLDKFDRVFGHVFKGLELMSDAPTAEIPSEWLKKLAEKYLTEEEKKQIEAMGGLDKLLETLRQRMKERDPPGYRAEIAATRHVARRTQCRASGPRRTGRRYRIADRHAAGPPTGGQRSAQRHFFSRLAGSEDRCRPFRERFGHIVFVIARTRESRAMRFIGRPWMPACAA